MSGAPAQLEAPPARSPPSFAARRYALAAAGSLTDARVRRRQLEQRLARGGAIVHRHRPVVGGAARSNASFSDDASAARIAYDEVAERARAAMMLGERFEVIALATPRAPSRSGVDLRFRRA